VSSAAARLTLSDRLPLDIAVLTGAAVTAIAAVAALLGRLAR
jgi:hypothetical protein